MGCGCGGGNAGQGGCGGQKPPVENNQDAPVVQQQAPDVRPTADKPQADTTAEKTKGA